MSRLNQPRRDALRIFRAALDAVDPGAAVERWLRAHPLKAAGRIFVVGAGKASARMAEAVERALGDRIAAGWVNVPDGVSARCKRIDLHASGHPIPDRRGVEGARRIMAIASEARDGDLLLCLISGGASALMPMPIPGLTLAKKQRITKQLLQAGADIHELNTVRKHLSGIKGGRLAAAAYPSRVVGLILSDVVGDNLDVIGSGPTVPDRTSIDDAAAVLDKYQVEADGLAVSADPSDPAFGRTENHIVASNRIAIAAAEKAARALGYKPLVLSTTIQGEARDVARMHAAIAREIVESGRPAKPPVCLLSGGETTVTVRGKGKGGRNTEFALAASMDLGGLPVTLLSAGTDGIDGPTDAAGAFADGSTSSRLDGASCLRNNDSYTYFEQLGDLVKTGPTGTNVMDLRVILIGAPPKKRVPPVRGDR